VAILSVSAMQHITRGSLIHSKCAFAHWNGTHA